MMQIQRQKEFDNLETYHRWLEHTYELRIKIIDGHKLKEELNAFTPAKWKQIKVNGFHVLGDWKEWGS